MSDLSKPCEIVQERSLNEQWGVDEKGEMTDFIDDGGSSEFSNYYCIAHEYSTESWEDMKKHEEEME